jgi:hypothetical protein
MKAGATYPSIDENDAGVCWQRQQHQIRVSLTEADIILTINGDRRRIKRAYSAAVGSAIITKHANAIVGGPFRVRVIRGLGYA